MSYYTEYKKALIRLRKIVAKKDFTESGEREYQAQVAQLKMLYLKACKEKAS